MSTEQDRIRLAEAMGWKEFWPGDEATAWYNSDGDVRDNPPNPFTDANDCDALISHMNLLGWTIEVCRRPDRVGQDLVIFWYPGGAEFSRITVPVGDWKEGVCKLARAALEVIDNDDR